MPEHQLTVDHDAPDHDRAYCSTCDNRSLAVEIGDLLRLHRIMSRNRLGATGCRGCRWSGEATPGTDAAWAEWVDHVLALTTPPVHGEVRNA